MPNLFLPGPAERKAERRRRGKKKKKRTGRIVKSATVHPDSLTGNAEERFWPLVVTAGWTSTDKTREEGEGDNTLWSFERRERERGNCH